MDSLPTSFTIEVNGAPITQVNPNAEDRTQAETGTEAAVFTLQNGRLKCGDWVLGRAKREDRSFLPKPVQWFKLGADDDDKLPVQPVSAHEEGDSYKLLFANASLMADDGKVLADLQGEQSVATVKMQ